MSSVQGIETPPDDARALINEAVAFLSSYYPEVLREVRHTAQGIDEELEPAKIMGGIPDVTAMAIIREKAAVMQRTLPLVALRCEAGAVKIEARKQRGALVQMVSEVISAVGGSTVLGMLADGAHSMAMIPATISLLGTLTALASKHLSLGPDGTRVNLEQIAHRLARVGFDARHTAEDLELGCRLGADGHMLRGLVNKGNVLAREANVALAPYLASVRELPVRSPTGAAAAPLNGSAPQG
jgi:hypothetical protein